MVSDWMELSETKNPLQERQSRMSGSAGRRTHARRNSWRLKGDICSSKGFIVLLFGAGELRD